MADWKKIGVPRWYDCKLGKLKDRTLAKLTGTTAERIRHRRQLFSIPAWTVGQAIAPYALELGIKSDGQIARLCGVSVASVKTYRHRLGISPRVLPGPVQTSQRLPAGHPVRPYRTALGLVPDAYIAKLACVDVSTVEAAREAFGILPAWATPDPVIKTCLKDSPGPGLGYESLFGTMSSAKISRATGVPLAVIEQRRQSLNVPPFKRVSKFAPYEHLLGVLSNNVLAKLSGLSPARIADIRKQNAVRKTND